MVMINNVFISFSAVQIYDISYIHFQCLLSYRSTSVMVAPVQDLDVIVLLVVPGKMYSLVIDVVESLD